MSKLTDYNGHFCESDYEYALIRSLENEGWQYLQGKAVKRETKSDVLIAEDFKKFLTTTNSDLTEEEVQQIYDNVRLVGAETDFATLHKVYGWMVNGIQFTTQNGVAKMINLIDFDNPNPHKNNIFRVVNQISVEYTNNGQKENRRPDVLLYVNGLPICIFELKNPADAVATIEKAWEQITICYWRDIPHLLHYCPLACISDGVKTRLGTVRTSTLKRMRRASVVMLCFSSSRPTIWFSSCMASSKDDCCRSSVAASRSSGSIRCGHWSSRSCWRRRMRPSMLAGTSTSFTHWRMSSIVQLLMMPCRQALPTTRQAFSRALHDSSKLPLSASLKNSRSMSWHE